MKTKTSIVLISVALSQSAIADEVLSEAPQVQPLAMTCFLDRMAQVSGQPGKVQRAGQTAKIFILVKDSRENQQSIVLDFEDRSQILAGSKFTKFDYIPHKPSTFMLWTTELGDPNNILLRVDQGKPDHENAVMAKRPDDPEFRYLGACLTLRSKDTRADYERMKATLP